jgi:hypothetical protein
VVVEQFSMPLRNPPHRRGGWRGSHFRAKVPIQLKPDDVLRIAIHDGICSETSAQASSQSGTEILDGLPQPLVGGEALTSG